ncbi:MAG: hypothetical protein IPL26_00240 [Leptospiraceae bacterium]|nr:hypothetical protein [Leptospiraceae bacterium]
MNYNIFLLTFDRDFTKYNYVEIHARITKINSLIDFWHYIRSCYILITTSSISELSEEIQGIMPEHRFLIVPIDLYSYNGYLPKDAWTWLRKYKTKSNSLDY